MDDAGRAITVVIGSVITLATVATILSLRANTANVIGAGGNALSSVISAAVAPVSGGGSSLGTALAPNLSMLSGYVPGYAGTS